MPSKTIKELRARAKARGLKGYTTLSRAELLKRLGLPRQTLKSVAKIRKTVKKSLPRTSTISAPINKTPTAPTRYVSLAGRDSTRNEPLADLVSRPAHLSSEEERVEDAKYAMTPRDIAWVTRPSAIDLGEDIETLPALTTPGLYLLPQKPGVLHAYWRLPPGAFARQPNTKLRLAHMRNGTLVVMREIDLPAERGNWYFNVDADFNQGEIYAHLGHYSAQGFVTTISRGITRLPNLHASGYTDPQWLISEERFREMYQRTGGTVRNRQLGWSASISSTQPDQQDATEQLEWAGPGVSSQFK